MAQTRTFALGVLAGVAGTFAVAIAWRSLPAEALTAQNVAVSVAREAGTEIPEFVSGCTRRAASVWSCEVGDRADSGTVTYRVTKQTNEDVCWTAALQTRDGEPMPRDLSGCAKRGD